MIQSEWIVRKLEPQKALEAVVFSNPKLTVSNPYTIAGSWQRTTLHPNVTKRIEKLSVFASRPMVLVSRSVE
jgi:hypothetical protein